MKQQRNQLIYEQRTVGKRTLQSIADEHGIHKERVRQICCKEERIRTRNFFLLKSEAQKLFPLLGYLRLIAHGD